MMELERRLRRNTEGNVIHENSVNAMYLWKILQNVILSEQHLRTYRECIDLYMKVMCANQKNRDFFTGSRGEGFHFDWSDIDILKSSITNYVFMENGLMQSNVKCVYLAIENDCQPGYCKLFFMDRSGRSNQKEYQYISRVVFLNQRKHFSYNLNSDHYIHGPCISSKHWYGIDVCNALPIHPDFSNAFLKNFSTKFWNNVKSKVINGNITVMHCVPKGPEKGDDEGLQWLISFTVLEQHIVRSLNHVQFCCYGLMKILLHTEIDSCSDTKDTISSYHLKTVLFHVLEDVHSDFWIPQNIFYCIRICLTRLLWYVINGCCPHYFKPECNLLLKRKILEKSKTLEKKLFETLKFDINDFCFSAFSCSSIYVVFCATSTLPDWNDRIQTKLFLSMLEFFMSEKSTFSKTLFITKCTVKGYRTTYRECIDSILMVMNLFQTEQDQLNMDFLKHLFLLLIRRIGIILYDKFILTRCNVYLLSAETAFMLFAHAGGYSCAYLATLWYCQGEYFRCRRLIFSAFINSPFVLGSVESTYDFKSFLSDIESQAVELYRASNLYPKDLKDDVQCCLTAEFIMYGEPYMLFLSFLCFCEMNCNDQRKNAFNVLQLSCRRFDLLSNIIQQNSKRLLQIAINKL